MSGISQNSNDTSLAKTKSSHEQMDFLLSRLTRFNLWRDTHILKIIQMKTNFIRSKKQKKKKKAKFSSKGEIDA